VSDRAFTVVLRDGTELAVAADQTILDALEEAGRRVLTSCREGNCGTCETAVLAGRSTTATTSSTTRSARRAT